MLLETAGTVTWSCVKADARAAHRDRQIARVLHRGEVDKRDQHDLFSAGGQFRGIDGGDRGHRAREECDGEAGVDSVPEEESLDQDDPAEARRHRRRLQHVRDLGLHPRARRAGHGHEVGEAVEHRGHPHVTEARRAVGGAGGAAWEVGDDNAEGVGGEGGDGGRGQHCEDRRVLGEGRPDRLALAPEPRQVPRRHPEVVVGALEQPGQRRGLDLLAGDHGLERVEVLAARCLELVLQRNRGAAGCPEPVVGGAVPGDHRLGQRSVGAERDDDRVGRARLA
eukprot:3608207-Rhodomonas_salina.2